MVKEDDSDIKEASDMVPALRNIEDQRSTQSRKLSLGKADVYPGRSQGLTLPRVQGWSYNLGMMTCQHIKN